MIELHPAVMTATLACAWFAAINLVASLISVALAKQIAEHVAADARRARLLLMLRLAPSTAALVVAGGLFLPAHIRLEPAHAGEQVGGIVIVLAGAALTLLVTSGWRLAGVVVSSARLASWARAGRRGARAGGDTRTIDVPMLGGIALAGIFRPRILIGAGTRTALTSEELDLAVAHELAHQHSHDNLARVAIRCAPDFLGWTSDGRRLERLWAAEAECLADAAAVDGSPHRAASLASALVKVARLGTGNSGWALQWSSLSEPLLLETRVRLLVGDELVRRPHLRSLPLAIGAVFTLATTAWIGGVPRDLHAVTEVVIALLP